MTGTIRRKTDKGFGFIATDGQDVFFHAYDCSRDSPFDSMKVGDNVEFDIEFDSRKGKEKGVNVRVI